MPLPMIMTSAETPHGRTVVSPLRLFAATHDPHIDRRCSARGFGLFPNDILTFPHRGNSPPENSCWKCDPHAGWESHFSKQAKKVKRVWAAQISKVAMSFCYFQENMFFEGITTPKVCTKIELSRRECVSVLLLVIFDDFGMIWTPNNQLDCFQQILYISTT